MAEISSNSYQRDKNPLVSEKILYKLAIKAENIKEKRPIKELESKIEENYKAAEAIENEHIAKAAIEKEQKDIEAHRSSKSRVDALKWMHLPNSSSENSLLKKMVRIRLLEILSDVKIYS